jgi:RNA-directed DNA polymerase
MITYADDFIVTAASKELLTGKVIPILKDALNEVGLELSEKKTRITMIEEGFDFLGFNVRKYQNGKVLVKPAKANVIRFLREIRTLIKKSAGIETEQLIHRLNQKITGWTNYYRIAVSSQIFAKIDSEIYQALNRWCLKRHPRKGKRWITSKYFTRVGLNFWIFYCITKDKEGNKKPLYLKNAGATSIRRHKKIRAEANPFDPRFKEYFLERAKERKSRETTTARSTGLRIIQPYASLSAVR